MSFAADRGERQNGHVTDNGSPWPAAIAAAAGLVLLFAVIPHGLYGDGYVRYLKLDSLLRNGSISSERYSYVGPLFAAPLWLFGDARAWWCARFNVLVLAAGALGAWFALRDAMTAAERGSFVLLLTAAGMVPNAARDFYGELFSAVAVGTGLMVVVRRGRWPGWILVVLGVANAPATATGLLLVAGWRFWSDRRLDGAVAFAAAATLIVLENWLTRGSPLATGYAGDHGQITVMPFSGMPGFSYPVVFGVFSLLFSFGKGLLFFAPGLLLVPHARRVRPSLAPLLDLFILFLAGSLAVYAHYWSWYGGWKWGPRYLLFAVYPASAAIAVALHTRTTAMRSAAVVAVAVWTVWVGVSGAVFDLEGLDACIANGYALEHLCWYAPEYSPLLRHFVLRPEHLAAWQVAWMVYAAVTVAILVAAGPLLPALGAGLGAGLGAAARQPSRRQQEPPSRNRATGT